MDLPDISKAKHETNDDKARFDIVFYIASCDLGQIPFGVVFLLVTHSF